MSATDWYFLAMVAAFCVAMVVVFWAAAGSAIADDIRREQQDRRDARDVKRGVL